MLVEMEKLERKHYLKHYLGGFAMVLREGLSVTGQIEEVDIEDGSVLIHAGERSQWVDGESVSPSLKQWKDMGFTELECLFNNLDWSDNLPFQLDIEDYEMVRLDRVIELRHRSAEHVIYINDAWAIYCMIPGRADTLITIKNVGTIIFLLCEMGYDVTGAFNK